MIYDAEPVCNEAHPPVPLELHVINFESNYYRTHPGILYLFDLDQGFLSGVLTVNLGRKKIDQVVNEFKRLTRLKSNDFIQGVFAVQMTGARSNQACRLAILTEKRPPLTLRDVLQDCDGLREDRVTVRDAVL